MFFNYYGFPIIIDIDWPSVLEAKFDKAKLNIYKLQKMISKGNEKYMYAVKSAQHKLQCVPAELLSTKSINKGN